MPAAPPGPAINLDRDRGIPDTLDGGKEAHFITDEDRVVKLHRLDPDRGDTGVIGLADCQARSRKIHLRQQPATENITARIRVCGHGNGPERRAAIKFRCISCHENQPSGLKGSRKYCANFMRKIKHISEI